MDIVFGSFICVVCSSFFFSCAALCSATFISFPFGCLRGKRVFNFPILLFSIDCYHCLQSTHNKAKARTSTWSPSIWSPSRSYFVEWFVLMKYSWNDLFCFLYTIHYIPLPLLKTSQFSFAMEKAQLGPHTQKNEKPFTVSVFRTWSFLFLSLPRCATLTQPH